MTFGRFDIHKDDNRHAIDRADWSGSWWNTGAGLAAVYAASLNWAEHVHGKTVIALGQSPVWPLHMAATLCRLQGRTPPAVIHLPFSGDMLQPDFGEQAPVAFREARVRRFKYSPDYTAHAAGRAAMAAALGGHCKHAGAEGREIVIADGISMGSGIATAAMLLGEHSPAALKRVQFIGFEYETRQHTCIERQRRLRFPLRGKAQTITVTTYSIESGTCMRLLESGYKLGMLSSRIVPNYPPRRWGTPVGRVRSMKRGIPRRVALALEKYAAARQAHYKR